MTKTEVREFATWARESLRHMEKALREDRLEDAEQYAMQASGQCGEAEGILRAMIEERS